MTGEQEGDPAVVHMQQARGRVAVLKLKLTQMRARCGSDPIFVVEGPDDKIVYSAWIRRIRLDLRYEYMECNGKLQVLRLRAAVHRDLGSLREGVYFFVDRDFDDLQGEDDDDHTFMTESYSVENYLVGTDVLDDILRVELHCNGQPEIRDRICQLFQTVYSQFLEETKEVNRRLFLSKTLSIDRKGSFPNRINHIAVVHIDRVEAQVRQPYEIIELQREPTVEECLLHNGNFDSLEPTERYRGKFALLFFNKWLELLADDYSSVGSKYFSELDRNARARRQEIVTGSLAARSGFPPGLEEFIDGVN